MIKILYVISPYYENDQDNFNKFIIPYGILSIDAYVKKYKTDIKSCIFDFNVDLKKHKKFNINSLKDKILEFNPTIIAISALHDISYNYIDIISSTINKISNKIFIVIGGGLPTNQYRRILNEFQYINAICYSEGEIPMLDLLNSTDYNKLTNEHSSWITKSTINKRPIKSLIYNLDDIPEFDYSLIDLNDYNNRAMLFNRNDFDKTIKKEMSIHTSRGCPFNCIFCASSTVHGKKVRYMSIERVINDVKNMIKNHNITMLIIEDDHFLSNKERAKEILRQLKKLNIKLEFPNGFVIAFIDEELAQLLKQAGTRSVTLAMESGSDYVLRNLINKPLKINMIKPKVEILRKYDINVYAFIVIGIPGETDEHRLISLNTIQSIGFDWVYISIAIPIAGSRLYDICIKNNYIADYDMNKHISTKATIKTPSITPEKMEEFAYYMNLSLNFVNNYNIKNNKYKNTIQILKNIVEKYPDHAFAHYFLAKSYKNINHDNTTIKKHIDIYNNIITTDIKWKQYSEQFNLEIL